jgi:hypothetical protein
MRRIDDVPAWAIGRCHATFRFLFHVQSALDDVTGAAKAAQWDVAVHSLRDATLLAASVSRMPQGCDVLPDASDDFTGHLGAFDAANDPALQALCAGVNRAAESPAEDTVAQALALLKNYLRDVESALGYRHEIPELRSARGTSMLLRLFREGDRFARSLGLPSAVPGDWANQETA